MSSRPALPIDALLPDVVRSLSGAQSLVLEAPPGAGKTTRVPPALLDARVGGDRELIVLQPRRLATRLAAQRVAQELGEPLGQTVGYQVRFEDVSGPRTRIRFVTEGVLTRRLLSDPQLRDVGVVLLDEFHERHLAGDLALALLRRLQLGERPDLKLVVMSATLDAGPVAQFLGGCPKLRSEGQRFEVAIEHASSPDERPLEQQVSGAIKRLLAANLDGHVLVFLPGAAEIRRAREACEELADRHGLELHALHGEQPNDEQDRAVRPGNARKLILSTNVAETSVTIDGIAAVVDSGLFRVASHSPWTGLPVLKLAKASRASCTQRAGRAGRTRAGRCVRLFTRADYENRPEHEQPEIRRLDLAETVLALRASGVREPASFPFFEPPAEAALLAADTLLGRLGAVAQSGELTQVGRQLLRFPLHPRLARVVVAAEQRGAASEGALLAALTSERDIRSEARAQLSSRGHSARATSGPSDLLEMADRYRQAEAQGFSAGAVRGMGLEASAVKAVHRVHRQLARLTDRKVPRPHGEQALEDALCLAVLAGFPDRVAKRRKPNAPEVLLFGGGVATLAETSVVRESEWLVAVDAEDRPRGGALVRLASRVEPEWLLDLHEGELSEMDELVWSPQGQRVERVIRMAYGNLVLEESRQVAPASEGCSRVLAQAARAAGVAALFDPERLEQLRARVELLASSFPEAGFAMLTDAELEQVVEQACGGLRSLAELREVDLSGLVESRLTPAQTRLLASQVPATVSVGHRQPKVHYERGKPPWVESRLQDFFGMARGPTVCSGRTPLVLHLLAPNMRAVQVTTDLAGFWERHYPAIRKELMRKYPRHSWPEDPRTAAPPAPRRH